MNRDQAKKIIKETVVESIKNFSKRSLCKKAKFQILDLIIPRERKIRSIVGGLETSLGTTLWEPLAKALAEQNGFQVIDEDLQCPTIMPAALSNTLQTVIDDRKKQAGAYNAESSREAIIHVCQMFIERPISEFENPPRGKGVDIWLKKNEVDYFFDTKTVQPNIGQLSSCLDQVLYWYGYYYAKNPTGDAQSRIVFPYNPFSNSPFWDSVIGKGKPLEPITEAWVENEFWDFCSGLDGTFQIILESFNEIHNSAILEDTLDELLRSN